MFSLVQHLQLLVVDAVLLADVLAAVDRHHGPPGGRGVAVAAPPPHLIILAPVLRVREVNLGAVSSG